MPPRRPFEYEKPFARGERLPPKTVLALCAPPFALSGWLDCCWLDVSLDPLNETLDAAERRQRAQSTQAISVRCGSPGCPKRDHARLPGCLHVVSSIADVRDLAGWRTPPGEDLPDEHWLYSAFGGARFDSVEIVGQAKVSERYGSAVTALGRDDSQRNAALFEQLECVLYAGERLGVLGVDLVIDLQVGLQAGLPLVRHEPLADALFAGAKQGADLVVGKVTAGSDD